MGNRLHRQPEPPGPGNGDARAARPRHASREPWRIRHPDRAAAYLLGAVLALTAAALADGAYGAVERHWLGIVAWGGVGAVAVAGWLDRARPPATARLLLGGLVGLLLLSTLSLAWTSSAERTVEEIVRVSGYLGVVTLLLLLVGRRSWQVVANGILIGALGVCGIALLAAFSPASFDVAYIQERLSHPFGYPNALAAWCAATLVLTLAWSVEQGDRLARALTLAAVPIAGVPLVLTYSRTGLVIAALGAAILVALCAHRRRAVAHVAAATCMVAATGAVAASFLEPGEGGSAGPSLLLLLLGCGALGWIASDRTSGGRYRRRSADEAARQRAARWLPSVVLGIALAAIVGHSLIGSGEAPPAGEEPAERLLSLESERPPLWGASLDAFAADPLTGIGPGTFRFFWSQAEPSAQQVVDAHSLYLEQLAELGLPGLLLTLAVVLGLMRASLAPLRAGRAGGEAVALPAAVVVFVVFAAVDWLWEMTAVGVLALACAAVASHGAERGRPGSDDPEEGRAHRQARPRAAIAALALVGIVVQVPGLLSATRVEDAAIELFRSEPAQSIERSSGAIEATPWAASPYAWRALARLAADRPEAALRDAREAARREPENYRHQILVFQAQSKLGNAANALAAYRRARELGYPVAPALDA